MRRKEGEKEVMGNEMRKGKEKKRKKEDKERTKEKENSSWERIEKGKENEKREMEDFPTF